MAKVAKTPKVPARVKLAYAAAAPRLRRTPLKSPGDFVPDRRTLNFGSEIRLSTSNAVTM